MEGVNSWSTIPESEWPSTSYRLFFVYNTDHPATLSASVIAASELRDYTYLVTCGTSCASSEFPEQTITHASGSSWAGVHTVSGDVTSWGCDLGSGSDDTIEDQYGECSVWVDAEDKAVAEVTAVNSCFVNSHSALVFITAGLDKAYEYESPRPPYDIPDGMISGIESELNEYCTDRSKTKSSSESGSTTLPASAGASATTTKVSETSSPTVTDQASKTDEDVAPSETQEDSEDSSSRLSRSILSCFGMALIAAAVQI